jgi:hypothetical protein
LNAVGRQFTGILARKFFQRRHRTHGDYRDVPARPGQFAAAVCARFTSSMSIVTARGWRVDGKT